MMGFSTYSTLPGTKLVGFNIESGKCQACPDEVTHTLDPQLFVKVACTDLYVWYLPYPSMQLPAYILGTLGRYVLPSNLQGYYHKSSALSYPDLFYIAPKPLRHQIDSHYNAMIYYVSVRFKTIEPLSLFEHCGISAFHPQSFGHGLVIAINGFMR